MTHAIEDNFAIRIDCASVRKMILSVQGVPLVYTKYTFSKLVNKKNTSLNMININIYVTGKLRNQAFHEMPRKM